MKDYWNFVALHVHSARQKRAPVVLAPLNEFLLMVLEAGPNQPGPEKGLSTWKQPEGHTKLA
jgi:hypothetical protein